MSRRFEIGVGLLVVGAAGLLAFMALQIGAIRGLGEDPVEVDALMDDVSGLSVGAAVAIAGVPVGRVEGLEVDFSRARVRLALDASANVRTDAIIAMRARSVLGEKYLEVIPVSRDAPLLRDGDTLTDTRSAVEIDQLVTRLAPVIEAIDPAVLSAAINSLSEAFRNDPERISRMLTDAERSLHNVAIASDQLDPTLAEARSTLTTVRRTTDSARPLITRAESTVARLDDLVAAVPPERVASLLDEVTAAVADGRAILVKLDHGSGQLDEVLTKANSVTREDILRITQEEGVLIRLRPRHVEDVLDREARTGSVVR